MLRVGLTGSLGSGKSTVAHMLAARGAHVLSSDEIGRQLMQPGSPVLKDVIERFGREIVGPDGTLDRATLARIVFDTERPQELEALNAIVHPAVIAREADLMEQIAIHEPRAIVVVESALIFETPHGGQDGWHKRFDCIILVRANDELKIARFLRRTLGDRTPTEAELAHFTSEAHRRLARQLPDEQKLPYADYILTNNGSLGDLERDVEMVWSALLERL